MVSFANMIIYLAMVNCSVTTPAQRAGQKLYNWYTEAKVTHPLLSNVFINEATKLLTIHQYLVMSLSTLTTNECIEDITLVLFG